MAIGSAIERGSQVFVYDERGQMLYSKPKGGGPYDGLAGFTGSAVTIQAGSVSYVYGEHGQVLYTKPV
jgi:hypothetical protein